MSATVRTGSGVVYGVRCHLIAGNGQDRDLDPDPGAFAGGAIVVAPYQMPDGHRFAWHEHPYHQLAWAKSGVLTVTTAESTWVLPHTLALWLPAGERHAVDATGETAMRSLYLARAPGAGWDRPTVVAVRPLLAELIGFLADAAIDGDARQRAEAVISDLLEPVDVASLRVPLPIDERALRVAHALVAEPATPHTVDQWGAMVGASGRTLARRFATETGMTFGHWRTHVRLRAGLARLAQGESVTAVAYQVGYGTPSAFVAAFRRALGVSPGAYFSR